MDFSQQFFPLSNYPTGSSINCPDQVEGEDQLGRFRDYLLRLESAISAREALDVLDEAKKSNERFLSVRFDSQNFLEKFYELKFVGNNEEVSSSSFEMLSNKSRCFSEAESIEEEIERVGIDPCKTFMNCLTTTSVALKPGTKPAGREEVKGVFEQNRTDGSGGALEQRPAAESLDNTAKEKIKVEEYVTEITVIKEKLYQLTEELFNMNRKYNHASEDFRLLQTMKDRISGEIDQLGLTKEELAKSLSNLEEREVVLKDRLNQLEPRKDDLEKEVENYEDLKAQRIEELDKLITEINHQRSELDREKKRQVMIIREFKRIDNMYENSKKEHAAMEKEISVLKAESSKHKNAELWMNRRLQELRGEISELKDTVEELHEKCEESEALRSKLDEECLQITEQKEELLIETEDLENRCTELEKRKDDLEVQVKDLEWKLNRIGDSISSTLGGKRQLATSAIQPPAKTVPNRLTSQSPSVVVGTGFLTGTPFVPKQKKVKTEHLSLLLPLYHESKDIALNVPNIYAMDCIGKDGKRYCKSEWVQVGGAFRFAIQVDYTIGCLLFYVLCKPINSSAAPKKWTCRAKISQLYAHPDVREKNIAKREREVSFSQDKWYSEGFEMFTSTLSEGGFFVYDNSLQLHATIALPKS